MSNDIKSLSPKQKLIHNIIFKLKSQGYDFKQLSNTLNKHNIRTTTGKNFYRSLVWNIYKRRIKRNQFMSKPIVKEYRDFDIVFIICELKSFINLLFFHNIVDHFFSI